MSTINTVIQQTEQGLELLKEGPGRTSTIKTLRVMASLLNHHAAELEEQLLNDIESRLFDENLSDDLK